MTDPTPIPSLLFSDLVIREQGTGKLSFVGAFNHILAPGFPFQTPFFFVTVFITNIQGPLDPIPTTMTISEKGSGHVIFSASGNVGFKEIVQRATVIEIPFPVPGCRFDRPGTYEAVLLINNERIVARDFTVSLPLSHTPSPQP
ncbi:MAG TPA: hypothetical protein VMN36_05915 [Verrucomicrobiales bacterium]|nr:hypothetical protein [Verrucomicrobiales bacterium]